MVQDLLKCLSAPLPPLLELSSLYLKKTALSAGVQNTTAFWEIWFNTEGQKLSLGHETVLVK